MEALTLIRSDLLTLFFKGITTLANQEFFYLLLPAFYWSWRKKEGFHLLFLLVLSSMINASLKKFFGWERPPTELWLIEVSNYAFPSTHAVTAAVVYGYLAFEIRKRWFSALSLFMILLIAFSRVYLGVHYPRDVIAGASLGASLLILFRLIVRLTIPYLEDKREWEKGIVVLAASIFIPLLRPDTALISGCGILAGATLGYLLEPYMADFNTTGQWYHHVLKFLVGLLIGAAIWEGFVWALPNTALFHWFRFFVIASWTTLGAPWLFTQMRLAKS